jgi:hypothetical protein
MDDSEVYYWFRQDEELISMFVPDGVRENDLIRGTRISGAKAHHCCRRWALLSKFFFLSFILVVGQSLYRDLVIR